VRARYDAVLFDLLTALLDSWTLWDRIAGSAADGRRWRAAYLKNTYATGAYRSYETLVAEAAREVGLAPDVAETLALRYGELRPWPEVPRVLGALAGAGLPLGVVTNCSQPLAEIAAAAVGVRFDVVVSAEQAGFYKPHPEPYRRALTGLGGLPPERVLFVAGSPFDLFGTAALGLPTFWHNRLGLALPAGAPPPYASGPDLSALGTLVLQPGDG